MPKEDREEKKRKKADEQAKKRVEEERSKALARQDAIYNKVNTEMKGSVIVDSDAIVDTTSVRRPSGIMQLDIDTAGGLPPGMNVLSGPEGSGKSRLLSAYMRMNQRIYGDDSNIFVACAEFAPTLLYLRKAGVMVSLPDPVISKINDARVKLGGAPLEDKDIAYFKKQIGRVKFMLLSDANAVLNTIVDVMMTNACQIICLDSISTLLTDDEDGKEVGERNQRGTHASAVQQFVKKVHPIQLGAFGANHTTLIAVSQVRAAENKPGTPAHLMKEWQAKGAFALRHGKLFDIQVKPGFLDKVKGEKVGKMVKWEITKGKSGSHDGIIGETPYYYENEFTYEGVGFDESNTVYQKGVECGVIKEAKEGKGPVTLLSGYTKEPTDTVIQTPEEFVELLDIDPNFDLFVREHILAAHGIECIYGNF